MEPNFKKGESYLGINKREIFSYFGTQYFVKRKYNHRYTPVRGEVYTIEVDGNLMLKRLIGIPGDVIQIKDGLLYINYIPAKYKLISDNLYLESHKLYKSGFYPEFYAYKCHLSQSNDENTVSYLLEDNEYWVMGDNREISGDSRDFGPITEESFKYLVRNINLNSVPILPKILVCITIQITTILSKISFLFLMFWTNIITPIVIGFLFCCCVLYFLIVTSLIDIHTIYNLINKVGIDTIKAGIDTMYNFINLIKV